VNVGLMVLKYGALKQIILLTSQRPTLLPP
jgi:hypothetical protein